MADLETKEDVVQAGVDTMSDVFNGLDQAYNASITLVGVVQAGISLEMADGELQAALLLAKSQALAGAVAQVKVLKQELHRELTDIAIANGVDNPAFRSGGR